MNDSGTKEKRVVLITGASSGLGLAIADLLCRHGFRVFGTSRRPKQAQIGGICMVLLDVCSPESIKACLQTVLNQAGRLDVLINNAGYIGPAAACEELSLEQLRAVFETNFFGVVQMTSAVLPVMRRQGGGQILNISSAAGLAAAPPFFSPYVASKHALEGYTEALRFELEPFNIHVSLIEPGYFHTYIEQTIEPPAAPLPAYAPFLRRALARDKFGIQHGRDPGLVARTVLEVMQNSSPALRYPVGLDALTTIIGKRFLPYPVFESSIRWLFLSGNAGSDARSLPAGLGLRRYLLESKLADRNSRALLAGLLVLAVLLVSRLLLANNQRI